MFGSTFLVSMALAFIVFAVTPTNDLILLVKLVALALGVTLLSPLWYPHLRGIKAGDKVFIANPSPFIKIKGRYGIAQEDGRKGSIITVISEDGHEVKCKIISYATTFSKAKVMVKDDAQVVEVR